MIKFCLLGSAKTYEMQKIQEEIIASGNEYMQFGEKKVNVEIIDGVIKAYGSDGTDLRNFDIYIVRSGAKMFKYISEYVKGPDKLIYEYYTNNYTISKFMEYIRFANASLPVPNSYIIGRYDESRIDLLSKNISKFKFPLILKGSPGRKGKTVFKCNSLEEMESILKETPNIEFLIQDMLGDREDIRVIVLNGEALGVMLKKANGEEFRTNVAQGGTVSSIPLTPEITDISINATKTIGADFAGVDIIFDNGKPYLLEANKIPQFEGFERSTGVNVAKKLVESLISKYSLINK